MPGSTRRGFLSRSVGLTAGSAAATPELTARAAPPDSGNQDYPLTANRDPQNYNDPHLPLLVDDSTIPVDNKRLYSLARWKTGTDLGELVGQDVALHFEIRGAIVWSYRLCMPGSRDPQNPTQCLRINIHSRSTP